MFEEEPRFLCKEEDGCMVLYDSRGKQSMKIILDPKEAAVYALLDDITPKRAVLEKTSSICTPEEAEQILDSFVEHSLAIRRVLDPRAVGSNDELYLGLALREGFRTFRRDEKISVDVTRTDLKDPSGKLVK